MLYVRNVVVVAAAAAATALTVLACCTVIRSIRMAYSYDIMSSCRRLLCFIVLMKMNDVRMMM